MQERRTLVLIDQDDIPSSAVAWDGSAANNKSGNVLYIPLYEDNYLLNKSDGSQAGTSVSASYGPDNIIRFPTYDISSTITSIGFTNDTTVKTNTGISIIYPSTYAKIGQSDVMSIKTLNLAGGSRLGDSYFGIALDPVFKNAGTQTISIFPCLSFGMWDYNSNNRIELIPNKYIKLKFSDAVKPCIKTCNISSCSIVNNYQYKWTYPIYIDNE